MERVLLTYDQVREHELTAAVGQAGEPRWLGYASTIHRAQGMTVDTSHAIASARSTREGVYVQLTRGARTNRLYVALEDGDRLDDVLAAIAARRRAQMSATESITALQREISAPGQLAAQFADVAERATTARLTGPSTPSAPTGPRCSWPPMPTRP
ncbi:helicase C-terminal domain-containing protein [Streptomyces sp. PmtA]|uniref:C-terminal helicase domain-containing protein n=1 Tax=Streptomyces sp. PmtA TaxID=3074275 RepID=UPI003014DE8B